jgi:hypothetical protein
MRRLACIVVVAAGLIACSAALAVRGGAYYGYTSQGHPGEYEMNIHVGALGAFITSVDYQAHYRGSVGCNAYSISLHWPMHLRIRRNRFHGTLRLPHDTLKISGRFKRGGKITGTFSERFTVSASRLRCHSGLVRYVSKYYVPPARASRARNSAGTSRPGS